MNVELLKKEIDHYVTMMLNDNLIYTESIDIINLNDLGVDSILFISIVIGLETKYDIVIPDEYISVDKFNTLEKITNIIWNIVYEKNN